MKKRLSFFIVFLISFSFLIACTKEKDEVEVYSFSGANEEIAINNGLIIVTKEMEKFVGGDLSFQGEELSDVKDYSMQFYFYDENGESGVLTQASTAEGADVGQVIPEELGEISSEDLFYGEDLARIKESLSFSLKGKLIDGDAFEYELQLKVKKVY